MKGIDYKKMKKLQANVRISKHIDGQVDGELKILWPS